MKKTLFSVCAIAIIVGSGCKSMNKTQKGAAIGAGSGAVIGGIIGNNVGKGNTALGAIIGGVVGGVAGGLIGKKMDKQAEEIKQAIPDANVERVGEGINVTFDSGILFALNSSTLSTTARQELSKIATIFKKYPDTNLLVEGHTDDTGKDEYNMQLSEKRAQSVGGLLTSLGVSSSRIVEKWYGETQPKYPNDSEANRKLNRRVEIAIVANEKMKEDAKDGTLGN